MCQLGGWGLWAIFGLVLYYALEDGPHPLDLLMAFGITVGLGVGLTHAYRAYLRAHGWVDLPLRALIPRVLLAAVLLSAGWNLIQIGMAEIGLLPASAGDASTLQKPVLLLSALTGGSLLLLIWSTIYFGLHFFWNYRQSEIDRLELAVQSREAKLRALRLQLNPHFLFNSLNSVRALVSEDPAQAQTMITRLARLLRKTLQSSKVLTVSFRDELRLARTYLELEAVRLEERLQFTIDADPATHEVPVPPLLVQTLVENAVKHGIAKRRDGGCVRVTARCEADDTLCVQVRNPGHLEQDTRDGGVGLQNLRERLRLLYGATATLTLSMDEPGTVLAEARLPQHAPAASDAASSSSEPTHSVVA
jgi:two-component sensor histidine kinase